MNVSQPTGSLISYDGVSFGTICCEHYRDSLINYIGVPSGAEQTNLTDFEEKESD